MYRVFSFFRFFVSFVSSSLRSFVQTVWFRGLRPGTIRPYELSDFVIFGRSYEEVFLPILSPRDAHRSAAADKVIGRTDWRSDRFIKAWAMPIIAKREGCWRSPLSKWRGWTRYRKQLFSYISANTEPIWMKLLPKFAEDCGLYEELYYKGRTNRLMYRITV